MQVLRAKLGSVLLCIGVATVAGLLSSCSPTGGVDVDTNMCPVATSGQQLLQELVDEALRDAIFVADGSRDEQHAFALSLIGIEEGYAGVAAATAPCTEATTFDAVCDSTLGSSDEPVAEVWETHDRCAQLSCAAAGVPVVTVYITTVPVTDPADRHTVEYDTTTPPGHIVYDINPLIAWRVDRSDPNNVVVSAELVGGILFTPTAGDGTDLTHAGEITIQKAGDAIESGSLHLLLASLSPVRTINVNVAIAPDASVSGTVTADDETIATINTGDDGSARFVWVGDCAP